MHSRQRANNASQVAILEIEVSPIERVDPPEVDRERAPVGRIQQMIDDEARKRFPEGAVRRVQLLLHGEDPAVEPGELVVRVLIDAAGAPQDYWETLEVWSEHKAAMKDFRRELAKRIP
jgi:hypothetical protein